MLTHEDSRLGVMHQVAGQVRQFRMTSPATFGVLARYFPIDARLPNAASMRPAGPAAERGLQTKRRSSADLQLLRRGACGTVDAGQVLGIRNNRSAAAGASHHQAKWSGQKDGGWQQECGVVLNHGIQLVPLPLDMSLRRRPCA
jgi:hypothetical protein